MKKQIRSYRDLDVYQNAYKAMLLVMTKILPALPDSERLDLKDQLSRSCKAVPRLIAEGYSKKHQKAGFQKYLADATSEANETAVSLTQSHDLYLSGEMKKLCWELIDLYDKIARQLYKLEIGWHNYKKPNDIRHT
jgi:four helix bundle protein